jgi:hypothetical protein
MACNNDEILRDSLGNILNTIAENHNISLSRKNNGEAFYELLGKIFKKSGQKIVVLIDECDKPLLDCISDREKQLRLKEVLREFYSVFKGCDEYVKFGFITGVTGVVFQYINYFSDITLSSNISSGFTHEELIDYFSDYMEVFCKKDNISKEELILKIGHYYCGYSWNGKDRFYNPHSILTLFSHGKFGKFRFSAGKPVSLIKFIKERKYELPKLEYISVSDTVFSSDNEDILSFMVHTGYLTVKNIDDYGMYNLYYPDYEVKETFLTYLFSDYIQEQISAIEPLFIDMKNKLAEENTDGFIRILNYIFCEIPYALHIDSYYNSIFYIIFSLLNINFDLLSLKDKRSISGFLEFHSKIHVMEFKYCKDREDTDRLLDESIMGLKERRYYKNVPVENRKILFLSVIFSGENIFYKIEQGNR